MHIPRSWARASEECRTRDNRVLDVAVWGWGDDDTAAHREAASRLQRLLERIRRGDPFPSAYAYGSRPVREEILQRFDGSSAEELSAVVTRNRYGALVLNTARLLFLDVDLPAVSLRQRLRRLFSARSADPAEVALATLREALRRYGRATFRLYGTAAGLRAIAVDREFDPAGQDAQELMQRTGTDRSFMRLCVAQRSFRARLTPKPWRCDCSLPPGAHPRVDAALRQGFADWVCAYEAASKGYATCRYIETVGSGSPRRQSEELIRVHDRLTRCDDPLPLA